MVTPQLLLLILVLGYSQADEVKFESFMPANKPFTTLIDPGFKVQPPGTFGKAEVKVCEATPAPPCYTDNATSTVSIGIEQAKVDNLEKLEFTGENGYKQTLEVILTGTAAANQIVIPTGKAFFAENIQLAVYPTGMVLVEKQSVRSGSADVFPPKPASECTAEKATTCLTIQTGLSHLQLQADMGNEDVILTLENADKTKKLIGTYKVCSAAVWASNSAAIIVGNLVLLFLLH